MRNYSRYTIATMSKFDLMANRPQASFYASAMLPSGGLFDWEIRRLQEAEAMLKAKTGRG